MLQVRKGGHSLPSVQLRAQALVAEHSTPSGAPPRTKQSSREAQVRPELFAYQEVQLTLDVGMQWVPSQVVPAGQPVAQVVKQTTSQ